MKPLFDKSFTKNPLMEMWVTLEYVSDEKPHPKGHPKHQDMKKGDRVKCCFTPPYTSILFDEPSFPLRGRVEPGAPIYKLVSIDRIIIKK